jgi:glycosyltransferase involved in cell wall biosynthesis
MGYPFGVEVVGDPHDVFAPGAVRHPLRPCLRWRGRRLLAHHCRRACAACYVTERALQARYPPGPQALALNASSIELRDSACALEPRIYRGASPARLVFVGSLEQYYKGPDVLIEAVARCRARGVDVHLEIIGDGRLRGALEALAGRVGCAAAVRFSGHLPTPDAVRARLDASDLFVLPSRTEGLPRAMVEAMARGLPCLGSDAGGIPELLQPEAVVPRGNVEALASAIEQLLATPARMHSLAAANVRRAQAYRHESLQARRTVFYRGVRDATERWLRARGRAGWAGGAADVARA